MKTRTEYTCPLELTHDITKGKWKPIILWQLGKGPHSLAGLKREIKGISSVKAAALYLRLKSRSGESARKCS